LAHTFDYGATRVTEKPPFDLDAAGNIILHPLTGYVTVPAAGMFIVARLEFADSEGHIQGIVSGSQKPSAVQLTITPSQAFALAERLSSLASHILSQQTPSGQSLS
jgi:hypothetical protein